MTTVAIGLSTVSRGIVKTLFRCVRHKFGLKTRAFLGLASSSSPALREGARPGQHLDVRLALHMATTLCSISVSSVALVRTRSRVTARVGSAISLFSGHAAAVTLRHAQALLVARAPELLRLGVRLAPLVVAPLLRLGFRLPLPLRHVHSLLGRAGVDVASRYLRVPRGVSLVEERALPMLRLPLLSVNVDVKPPLAVVLLLLLLIVVEIVGLRVASVSVEVILIISGRWRITPNVKVLNPASVHITNVANSNYITSNVPELASNSNSARRRRLMPAAHGVAERVPRHDAAERTGALLTLKLMCIHLSSLRLCLRLQSRHLFQFLLLHEPRWWCRIVVVVATIIAVVLAALLTSTSTSTSIRLVDVGITYSLIRMLLEDHVLRVGWIHTSASDVNVIGIANVDVVHQHLPIFIDSLHLLHLLSSVVIGIGPSRAAALLVSPCLPRSDVLDLVGVVLPVGLKLGSHTARRAARVRVAVQRTIIVTPVVEQIDVLRADARR